MNRILMLGIMGIGALAMTTTWIGQADAQQHHGALFPPTPYDGVYSVTVTPTEGSCTPSHWAVTVRDGEVASISPNTENISALGLIETDGSVSLTFTSGQGDYAHVGGTITGQLGKGFWSAPTLRCGGVWNAEKMR
jgi:hypothetical protein